MKILLIIVFLSGCSATTNFKGCPNENGTIDFDYNSNSEDYRVTCDEMIEVKF